MQRTTIEAAADGHILITLERNNKLGGNAHQRRIEKKRELNGTGPVEWYRMGRVILRDGVPAELPVKFAASRASITLLPLGSPEITNQAAENEAVAADSTCYAYDIVAAIAARTTVLESNRFIPPAKKRRLMWVEEAD